MELPGNGEQHVHKLFWHKCLANIFSQPSLKPRKQIRKTRQPNPYALLGHGEMPNAVKNFETKVFTFMHTRTKVILNKTWWHKHSNICHMPIGRKMNWWLPCYSLESLHPTIPWFFRGNRAQKTLPASSSGERLPHFHLSKRKTSSHDKCFSSSSSSTITSIILSSSINETNTTTIYVVNQGLNLPKSITSDMSF